MRYILLVFFFINSGCLLSQSNLELPDFKGKSILPNHKSVVYEQFKDYDWVMTKFSTSYWDKKIYYHVLAFKNDELFKYEITVKKPSTPIERQKTVVKKTKVKKKRIRVKKEDYVKIQRLFEELDSITFFTMDVQSKKEYSSNEEENGSVKVVSVSDGASSFLKYIKMGK